MPTLTQKILNFSLIYLMLLASLIISRPVYAEAESPLPSAKAQRQLERQQERLDLRRTKADQEIERRLKALNHLITVINKINKISEEQKSALVAQVQAEIDSLTALKAKIDADTDPAVLKADKQAIVKSYRIFALFIPKIRIIAHADRILGLADELTAKTTDSDALAKINDAKTQAQNAINAVSPLTPEGYPDNKTTLQNARTMLQTARQNLKAAWQLIKNK